MRVRKLWQSVEATSPFGGDFLLTAATNILIAAIGLGTGILAARLLGTQGRGELAAIQLWPVFLAPLAAAGLPEAVVYLVARKPELAGRYTGSAFVLATISSLFLILAGFLVIPILLSAQSTEIVESAQWYLLLILISVLIGIPLSAIRGRNETKAWNALRPAIPFAWLVVLIVALISGNARPEFVAAGYLLALGIVFIPTVYVMTMKVMGPFWPDPANWKPLLGFGVPIMLSSIPQLLNLRLDQLLIAAFLPTRLLGLYVIAVAWSGAIRPIVGAMGAVLFPRVAAERDPERQRELFAQGSRLGALAAVLTGLLVFAVTPLAIPLLFGEDFSDAVPAALILVIAGVFASMNVILEQGLQGLGRPTAVMWSEFIGLSAMVAALWMLLRPFGLVGAAASSLASYSAVMISLIVMARRNTGYSPISLLLPRIDDFIQGRSRARAVLERMRK